MHTPRHALLSPPPRSPPLTAVLQAAREPQEGWNFPELHQLLDPACGKPPLRSRAPASAEWPELGRAGGGEVGQQAEHAAALPVWLSGSGVPVPWVPSWCPLPTLPYVTLDLAHLGVPGGFFQGFPPGWDQQEGIRGRNPVPSGLPGVVAANVPKVLKNDPFHVLRARAPVCWWSVGGSHSEGLRAEVRRGLQEPGKGCHLELRMARTRGR